MAVRIRQIADVGIFILTEKQKIDKTSCLAGCFIVLQEA